MQTAGRHAASAFQGASLPRGGASFVAQRLNGVQPGRFVRRIIAEEHADGHGERHRNENNARAGRGRIAQQVRTRGAQAQARQNPQNAPDEADDDGFHDELHTDAAVRRAQRLAVPISRVRSVMDTSMIFITPMPPTSRLMPAMTAMARLMVESISVLLSIRLSMLEAVAV